jgi:hypothetical protein
MRTLICLLASSNFERFTYCVEVAVEHPIRFFRSVTIALMGAGVFATAGFVGPATTGQAAVATAASALIDDAAFLEPPDPDPSMPLPEIDEPAIDAPSPPPTSHHRHHPPSWHPRG